jgi:mono/diheme cytochrome c family protein
MSRNTNHPSSAGLNLFVATDQRVFPIRMNTAVNRGYLPDVLDPTGKLYVFASSCSPLIYRGDNFPSEFVGNAFVCDSAANLIKRNIVFDQNLTLTSRFAYENAEYLASTDERFRPVGLSNGPDGTIWVVDMYRGINQYGMFMTEYLRKESLTRGLDKGIHFGRIYRIVSTEKPPAKFLRLSDHSSLALVDQLSHPNGWIRDTAQRLLVERADRSIVPELLELISNGRDTLGRIHGLWTLEGLCTTLSEESLSTVELASDGNAVALMTIDPGYRFITHELDEDIFDTCYDAMANANPQVQIAAIRVAESITNSNPDQQTLFRLELEQLVDDASPEVIFQIALTAGNLAKPDAMPLLVGIAANSANQSLIREAIVSGLYRWEVPFLKMLLNDERWISEMPRRATLLQTLATAIMRERHPVNIDELLALAAGQSSDETKWRRRSLLAGVTAKTGGRPGQLVRLKSEPKALEQLSQIVDADMQQHVEQIKSLFAWPGHQFDRQEKRPAGRSLTADELQLVSDGKAVFQKVCAGCHGLNGEGIRPLAAPLVDSDWVLGSEERLIRVLLHGLTGPVEVDGITYQPPIVLPEMPAVGNLDDFQISAVLSYIRREWGHDAEPISADQVAKIRNENSGRTRPWTAEELLGIGK